MLPPSSETNVTYSASSIIVAKSAMTATNNIVCPMTLFVKFSSFNVGSTMPREIVEIMSVIKKGLSTKRKAARITASKYEIAKINMKMMLETKKLLGSFLPSLKRLEVFFVKIEKSISAPLKNIKKIKPNVDKISSHGSLPIKLNPLFPI